MINYTEEYFEKEKERLYNEIMSPIKLKVEKASDKKFAYKYHLDRHIEGYYNQILYPFGYLENSIAEKYEEFKLLNSKSVSSLFLLCFNEDKYNELDPVSYHDVLYDIGGYCHQYSGIKVETDINYAKNELINNESNLLLYKTFLESEDDRVIDGEINPKSKFLNLNSISFNRMLENSLIGKDEEIERESLEKDFIQECNKKLSDFNYISNIIIQHDVLKLIINELETIHKTEKIECFSGYIFEGEVFPTYLDLPQYSNYNKEDWQRVQLQIFDLNIVKQPKDFIIQDFSTNQHEEDLDFSNNRKPLAPIKWNGTQRQLSELFVELERKGWIELTYLHKKDQARVLTGRTNSIKQCFTVSNSIDKYLRPGTIISKKNLDYEWTRLYFETDYKPVFDDLAKNS